MLQPTGQQNKLRDLLSSESLIKDRVSNDPFWADIRGWLEDRIEDHQMILESPSSSIEAIRFSQGIVANCKDLLDLPNLLIAEIQATQGQHQP